jgi:glyoxylase-like metal-dependent hydrolase (beta-lactamase superfamily II)
VHPRAHTQIEAPRRLSRRIFLADLGRRGVAALVVTSPVGLVLAACSDDETSTTPTTATATAATAEAPAATSPTGAATPAPATAQAAAAARWHRVQLANVSAYVIAHGAEAAIVDTGVAGSAADIEAALGALGFGWDAVGHVVVTHSHPDHMGSLAAVMDLAPLATAYGGAADIAAMTSPRPVEVVGDGDRVFDLEIIETPGHTPGHISILDGANGLLVAGDALNGVDGGVGGPNARFTADMATANVSVVKLAAFEFDTVVFGHGDPVEGGASALVAELAATL